MEAKPVDVDGIFKVFTACPNDPKTLLLDVRPQKEYKKGHINQAFNPRLATNGKFLADYSQSQYAMPWSQDCWWGKPVIVYGPRFLNKDHPVIKFLAEQQRCTSVSYFKQGFEAFEAQHPYLCTTSVKANSYKKYPSVIIPSFLYLGDWKDAEQADRLKELRIKRIITVHNHPDRLQTPPGVKHMKIELPDIGTADISAHFNSCYEFLAEAERLKQPVLVHCGAGVSRSACVVMMFLMRSKRWSAQQARGHCIAARSLVTPNDGFWRVLCALEGPLGIMKRSDPNATMGFAGADAPAVKLDTQAAGQPVQVRMLSANEVKQAQEAAEKAASMAAAAAAATAAAAVGEGTQQQQQQQQQQLAIEQQQQPKEPQHQPKEPQHQPEISTQRKGVSSVLQETRGRGRSRSRSKRRSSSSSSGGSSSSGSDSSSSSSDSSSSDSSTSSDSDSSHGGSKERPRLRRPPKAADQPGSLRRPQVSSSRSRSRSRDRHAGHGSRHDPRNGAAAQKRSRSRSRSRSPHKRRRASRSRSRSRDRHRHSRDVPSSRHDHDGTRDKQHAAPAAAAQDGVVAGLAGGAGACELQEPLPQQEQSGWLVKLEVTKPGGLVGHLLLGPLDLHQRVVFGRAPACDVVLEHLSISRQHAQLTVDMAGAVCLMDLGSAHGTKLNDAWIKSQQQRTMAVGSCVQFGASTRKYKLLEVQKL